MSEVLSRLTRFVGVVRPVALGSLETSGERARERHRRIALSAGAALFARAVAVLVNLVSIPLALSALGPERYGVWVALSAFVLMLAFTDLGVGGALLNLISEADGRNDRPAMVSYVSSAFVVMGTVAVVLLGLFAIVYRFVDWAAVLRVSGEPAASEVGPTVIVTFVLFAVGIPLAVAQRAQMGRQEGFAVSVWQALGSLAGLAGLVLAIRAQLGMVGVALALAGGVTLGSLANCIALFGQRPWLLPRASAFSAAAARLVLRRGVLFFVLQVAASLAFLSDNLVADQVLGPEAAARYSVAQRLYFLLPVIVALTLMPLWPAYSEAIARGDRSWVRSVFSRSVLASVVVVGLAGLILTVFREPIFSRWVGADLVPSFTLAVGLLVWSALYAWGSAVVVLLNAANVIGLQVIAALSMGVGSLFLKAWFASLFGIDGIVWGMVLGYTALTFIPYTIYFLSGRPVNALGDDSAG